MIEYSEAKEKCDEISSQISDTYSGLNIRYILFHNNQHNEAVMVEEDTLAVHPAGTVAKKILSSIPDEKTNKSTFLGLAAHVKPKFFGLRNDVQFMGLIMIHIDKHETLSDLIAEAYHYSWHAISLLERCLKPENKARLRSVPVYPAKGTIVECNANMRADIFSAVMMEFRGHKGYAHTLAEQRTLESLTTTAGHSPEDYPFPLAIESTEFALESLKKWPKNPSNKLKQAYSVSKHVGRVFDEDSIQQWWDFSSAAQEMAWKKISKEAILGAATNTSDNPFIKATGLLLSNISGITPSESYELEKTYNAFISSHTNKERHLSTIDERFEAIMEQGLKEESNAPFIKEANHQNDNLRNGVILGWCASALHAAGNAFEGAIKLEKIPEHAARLEFEGRKGETKWEELHKLSGKIQNQQRDGYAVTLTDIATLCEKSLGLSSVLSSIEKTLKDPSHISRFSEEPNFALARLGPSTPQAAPKVSPPVAAPAMAPPTPGLGSRATVRRPVTKQQTPPQTNSKTEKDDQQ